VIEPRIALSAAILALASCGYRPAAFVDAPLVVDAGDEQPVELPQQRHGLDAIYWAEAYAERGVTDNLEVSRHPMAVDVNRLDEVVRSSWFRGAVGLDPLHDYALDGPPEPPWLPTEDAPLEVEPALGIVDARGLGYQLVLDIPGEPETRTAAMAIASRLFYALGYRAVEAHVVTTPSGQRATAVRWPPGRDLGPTPLLWTRDDDPNDVLRHEDRRTLRATWMLAAWLDMPRFPEHLFRDAYVGAPGRGFVRHYLVGFEGALGTDRLLDSLEDARDPDGDDTGSGWLLLTLGFYPKSDRLPPTDSGLLGVGLFEPHVLLDEAAVSPPFAPHDRMRPDDAYWIAKRMAAQSDATLTKALRAGELSDPRAARYILSALKLRRRALVEQAFAAVTPCDVLSLSPQAGGLLTLVDHEARLEGGRGVGRYRVEVTDVEGDSLAPPRLLLAPGARFGISVPTELFADRAVVVLRIFKVGPDGARERSLDVHLKRRGQHIHLFGVEH
jgi:hypothetical protein